MLHAPGLNESSVISRPWIPACRFSLHSFGLEQSVFFLGLSFMFSMGLTTADIFCGWTANSARQGWNTPEPGKPCRVQTLIEVTPLDPACKRERTSITRSSWAADWVSPSFWC